MAGRAGRQGRSNVGESFLVQDPRDGPHARHLRGLLARAEARPLRSQLLLPDDALHGDAPPPQQGDAQEDGAGQDGGEHDGGGQEDAQQEGEQAEEPEEQREWGGRAGLARSAGWWEGRLLTALPAGLQVGRLGASG